MPLDHGNAIMSSYTRIVNYDPIPHIGYAKVEVKEEPQVGQPTTETVIVTSVPEDATTMHVWDLFTVLTPVGHPALQVRFDCHLNCNRFFNHLCT